MSFAKIYSEAKAKYKPLNRAPMKRGSKPLQRKSPLKAHRQTPQEKKWREVVLKQADYRCQWVDQQGVRCQVEGAESLEAHHAFKRSQRPDLRDEISGGRALCIPHHDFIDTVEGRRQAIANGMLQTETYELAQKRKKGMI